MSYQLRLFLTAMLFASLTTFCIAADKLPQSPSQIYLLTNDDGLLHSYVSFFTAGGTQGAPTLTFANNVNTQGLGIGGGYFAAPRLAMLPSSTAQCVFASNAGTATISGINIQTQTLAGQFSASEGDAGDANGIGLVQNTTYLYAGYSSSNTIATFSVSTGCQLSFPGRYTCGGLERRFGFRHGSAWKHAGRGLC